MAINHEDAAAELHATIQESVVDKKRSVDLTGAPLPAVEKGLLTDVEAQPTADGEEPTEHEKSTLRRIGDDFPKSAFLIAAVELCERFTCALAMQTSSTTRVPDILTNLADYGCQGLFQNYIANSPKGYDGARGLGLGHAGATGLNVFFQFFCYVTPILGAIISDQYLGKYKTIVIFAGIYWVGLVILWTTALPTAIDSGASLGGYIAAIIVIAFGTGGIKSNIAPLIADQYNRHVMAVHTLPKTGERVIIDPAITYQRIYMVFYWCINVGSLSLLATPFMEKYKGFWTAYVSLPPGKCLKDAH
jgi:proton-dependent oligopeptide transporter, POT family